MIRSIFPIIFLFSCSLHSMSVVVEKMFKKIIPTAYASRYDEPHTRVRTGFSVREETSGERSRHVMRRVRNECGLNSYQRRAVWHETDYDQQTGDNNTHSADVQESYKGARFVRVHRIQNEEWKEYRHDDKTKIFIAPDGQEFIADPSCHISQAVKMRQQSLLEKQNQQQKKKSRKSQQKSSSKKTVSELTSDAQRIATSYAADQPKAGNKKKLASHESRFGKVRASMRQRQQQEREQFLRQHASDSREQVYGLIQEFENDMHDIRVRAAELEQDTSRNKLLLELEQMKLLELQARIDSLGELHYGDMYHQEIITTKEQLEMRCHEGWQLNEYEQGLLEAARTTLAGAGALHEYRVELNPQARRAVVESEVDGVVGGRFIGNALQGYMYTKCAERINNMGTMQSMLPHNDEMFMAYAHAHANFSGAALYEAGHTELSMAWDEVAYGVYNEACFYFNRVCNAAGSFAVGAVKGAAVGGVANASVNALLNLSGAGTIGKIIKAIDKIMIAYKGGVTLSNLSEIKNKVGALDFDTITDEQMAHEAGFWLGSFLIGKDDGLTSAVKRCIRRGVDSAKKISKLELAGFRAWHKTMSSELVDVAGAKVAKEVGEHIKILEKQIGRPITGQEAKHLHGWYMRAHEVSRMPLNSAVLAEVEGISYLERQFGREAVEGAFAKIEVGSTDSLAIQILERIDPGKTSKEYYKHIFLGDMKNGRGSGLHMARNNPGVIKKVIEPPNEHGVYMAKWQKAGMKRQKLSTFPPDDMNRVEYLNRVRKAYHSPTGKAVEIDPSRGVFRIQGKDGEGVVWEMIVKRNGATQEYLSAYPKH